MPHIAKTLNDQRFGNDTSEAPFVVDLGSCVDPCRSIEKSSSLQGGWLGSGSDMVTLWLQYAWKGFRSMKAIGKTP